MINCVIYSVLIGIVFHLESTTALDVLPKAPECGIFPIDRTLGSNEAAVHQHPWLALIEYSKPNNKKSFVCSGVLISKRFVVTAAHCVSGKNKPITWSLSNVRLGEYDLLKQNDCAGHDEEHCNPAVVNMSISETIVHELYDPLSKNATNDIALLRLESDVIFTDFVKPICLPRDSKLKGFNYDNVVLSVAGWYRRTDEYSVKQVGQVTGINNAECSQGYTERSISLQDSQLCVKTEGVFDTCESFSGTPIMKTDSNDRDTFWYLVGLVSFGPVPCGKKDALPDVTTRIDSYVDWIESKVYA